MGIFLSVLNARCIHAACMGAYFFFAQKQSTASPFNPLNRIQTFLEAENNQRGTVGQISGAPKPLLNDSPSEQQGYNMHITAAHGRGHAKAETPGL